MMLRAIIFDFDGVIHTFDKGWHDGTCYGEPIPGALEAIKNLSKEWNIIVFGVGFASVILLALRSPWRDGKVIIPLLILVEAI